MSSGRGKLFSTENHYSKHIGSPRKVTYIAKKSQGIN